ncbi:FACT complex subunit pob3 [Histoplasma capsulatum]|uniref:FACT complex subunit pob3 n=1 Tax=Ajellomyces capsulatus TaxID=5037 RepID=A0A8A1M927_AJECA|nr:FACT complex subunit pob3 [Histoplasma capsulatum]
MSVCFPTLARESFENIYLDLSKHPGKCKLAESGLGWRPSGGGDTILNERARPLRSGMASTSKTVNMHFEDGTGEKPNSQKQNSHSMSRTGRHSKSLTQKSQIQTLRARTRLRSSFRFLPMGFPEPMDSQRAALKTEAGKQVLVVMNW